MRLAMLAVTIILPAGRGRSGRQPTVTTPTSPVSSWSSSQDEWTPERIRDYLSGLESTTS